MGLVSSFLGAAATAAPASARTAIEQPTQTVQNEHIDQCGMENDPNLVPYEPLERIKECQLSKKLQEDFQKHLDTIFSNDSLWGQRVRFVPNDVLRVIEQAKVIVASEPMLIDDVPYGVTIVADLHGQLHDLHRVFHADSKDGKPGWLCTKYVFLGDYVDRGRQSLEILMALFCLKALYPDRIFLLRGNHEFGMVNHRYGFPVECLDRYRPDIAEVLYYKWNELFCYVSVAAIVGDKFFCTHGGISTSGMTRRQLKRIPKPIISSNDDTTIHDLVWSDPANGLKGASFNCERQSSLYYGLDVLAQALEGVGCIGLFRGHTMLDNGVEIVGRGMCIALFTATSKTNDGAVALMAEDGKLTIRKLNRDLNRVAWDHQLKLIDARLEKLDDDDYNDEKDELTTFGGIEAGQTGQLMAFMG